MMKKNDKFFEENIKYYRYQPNFGTYIIFCNHNLHSAHYNQSNGGIGPECRVVLCVQRFEINSKV